MAGFDSKLSAVMFLEKTNNVNSEGKTGVKKSKNNTAVKSP